MPVNLSNSNNIVAESISLIEGNEIVEIRDLFTKVESLLQFYNKTDVDGLLGQLDGDTRSLIQSLLNGKMDNFTFDSLFNLSGGVLSLNGNNLSTLLNLAGKMNVFSLANELLFDGNILKINPTNLGNMLNLAGKMNVFSLADELLFDGNVLKVNPTNMGNILNLAGKMNVFNIASGSGLSLAGGNLDLNLGPGLKKQNGAIGLNIQEGSPFSFDSDQLIFLPNVLQSIMSAPAGIIGSVFNFLPFTYDDDDNVDLITPLAVKDANGNSVITVNDTVANFNRHVVVNGPLSVNGATSLNSVEIGTLTGTAKDNIDIAIGQKQNTILQTSAPVGGAQILYTDANGTSITRAINAASPTM
jgi:hypothetical protein